VQAVLPVREFSEDRYVFFATRNGTVKKTPLSDYSRPRATGIWAINLDEGDGLVDVQLTDGASDIMLFASNGKAVRFDEASVRPMGRTATGVRGMRLADGEQVMSLIVVDGDGDILTASENGFGKRTDVGEYRVQSRGGIGLKNVQTSERNGSVVGIACVTDRSELLLVTEQGQIIRMKAADLRPMGRDTQGVRLMDLAEGDRLVSIVALTEPDDVDAGT
jgi:DNA gyrase subunit A